ncbi:hypothetical protein RHS01_04256 [Rhizoctonia solani]|uniref:Uncharacterized protein n=1 Tax=Rhizoctonia solani TaxID=456999 RepID=A0A8H7IJ52_9AGAM|nr:hypothetical protein RHS01_04256 [Rhizoctonia solani]
MAKFHNNMASMLGNVGVTWELVPYNIWATVLTKAAYPVLYHFPEDWAGKALMKTVCKNKHNTKANEQGQLCRGKRAIKQDLLKEEPVKQDLFEEEPIKEDPFEEEPVKEDYAFKEPVDEELAGTIESDKNKDDIKVQVSLTRTAGLGKKCCHIEDSNSKDEQEVKQPLSTACTLAPTPTPTSNVLLLKLSACTSNAPACPSKSSAPKSKSASKTSTSKAPTPTPTPTPTLASTNMAKIPTAAATASALPSLKRKAQPKPNLSVESNLETATKPAKPLPTKHQKGNILPDTEIIQTHDQDVHPC